MIAAQALIDWLCVRAEAGRRDFAHTLRALVVHRDAQVAERLPFERDEVFLEPGLFTLMAVPNSAGASLHQVLGAVLTGDGDEPCTVRSNADGSIDVPRLGRLLTARGNADFLISRKQGELRLDHAGGREPFRFEPSSLVRGIELFAKVPLHFRPLVPSSCNAGVRVEPELFGAVATRALEAVAAACPALGRCLREHLRAIVAIDDPQLNSFAAVAAHGAIFVSTVAGPTVPQMVEEIAHQGGHVIFNAATIDAAELFRIDPTSAMRPYSAAADDSRSVYDALHGLVTEALMVVVLDRCLDLRRWTARERSELQGRLAYIGIRGHGDLASFADPGPLSEQGCVLRDLVAECLYPPLHRRRSELATLDLSQQPYAFDETIYRRVNGFDAVPAPA